MSCGEAASSTSAPRASPVATYASGAQPMLAAAEGTLELTDGCIMLSSDDAKMLPVFPAEEIEWDGETLSYQGRNYRPGDRIEVGGGQMPLEELTGLSLPEGCPDGVRPFIVA